MIAFCSESAQVREAGTQYNHAPPFRSVSPDWLAAAAESALPNDPVVREGVNMEKVAAVSDTEGSQNLSDRSDLPQLANTYRPQLWDSIQAGNCICNPRL